MSRVPCGLRRKSLAAMLGPHPLMGWADAGLVPSRGGRGGFWQAELSHFPGPRRDSSTDQCHRPRAWSSCSVPGCVLIQMGSRGSEKLSNLPEDTQLLLVGPE